MRPVRFERTAFGSGGQRSIQLSYGRIFYGIEYTQNSEKTVVDSGLSRINHGA